MKTIRNATIKLMDGTTVVRTIRRVALSLLDNEGDRVGDATVKGTVITVLSRNNGPWKEIEY